MVLNKSVFKKRTVTPQSLKLNGRRYRWPDEVLARLLKLNTERAEEKRRAGEPAAASAVPTKPKNEKRAPKPPSAKLDLNLS